MIFRQKVIPPKGFDYVLKVIDDKFIISFISYIEFLDYKNATTSMESFIALADVIEINKSIINQTILLRKTKKIKLADAIIASTAMVHNLILISRNIKDFENIAGLELINPYKL